MTRDSLIFNLCIYRKFTHSYPLSFHLFSTLSHFYLPPSTSAHPFSLFLHFLPLFSSSSISLYISSFLSSYLPFSSLSFDLSSSFTLREVNRLHCRWTYWNEKHTGISLRSNERKPDSLNYGRSLQISDGVKLR